MARKPAKVNYSGKIARRRERRAKFRVGLFVALPIVFCLIFVFVMRLDALQVKNISVSGTDTLSPEDIKTEVSTDLEGHYLVFIPKKNIFFIDNKNIANVLTSQFGRLKSVQIETGVSGDLSIKVEERVSRSIWCNQNEECYLMDEEGLIFSIASEAEKKDKIIFRGQTLKNEGEKLIHFKYSNELADFFSIVDLLKNREIDTKAFSIISDEKASAFTSIGEIVFGPLDADLLATIDNATLVFENLRKTNPNIKFEYIDVRFGSKVYYKTF